MKTLIKITLGIVLVLMFCLSIIGIDKTFARSIFIGGSTESLMDVSSVNMTLQLVLTFISIVLAVLYFRKNHKKLYLILFTLTLFMWILAGRTIAVSPYGKVITGWNYIEFNSFEICLNADDCETTVYYDTRIERLSFWRIEIKNKNVEKRLFLGPIVWRNTLNIINKHFPNARR